MTTPPEKKVSDAPPSLQSPPAARRSSGPMVRPPEPGRSETVVLREPKPAKGKPKPKSIDKR
jgi:hypothetical protein